MNTEKRRIDRQPNARRPVNLTEIRALLAEGLSLRATTRKMSVGYGTLYRPPRWWNVIQN
jgi:hypothetical protein